MIYKDRLTMVLKIYALRVKGQCFTLNLPNISPKMKQEKYHQKVIIIYKSYLFECTNFSFEMNKKSCDEI